MLLLLAPCSTLLLLLLVSNWYLPPWFFLWVWEKLSKFKFFRLDLESEIFFFNLCLLMNFFIIHVIGKFWLTKCLFVVHKNYLDILKVVLLCEPQQIQFLHFIIHIASHFYKVHFICTITLCIFSAHCICF